MYCSQCQKKIQAQDSFCRYCGFPRNNENTNIKIGNENIVSGDGNFVGNNYGSITNNVPDKVEESLPKLQLVETKEIPIKSIWITIVGSIGFISSILTIISYYKQYGFINLSAPPQPIWYFFLGAISCCLAGFGFTLLKNKQLIGTKIFQTNSQGYITISNVYGKCPAPNCRGVIRVEQREKNQPPKLICNIYPDRHQFNFYMSELPK